ncbi:MAG: flippase [Patescibacteria group bacterium]
MADEVPQITEQSSSRSQERILRNTSYLTVAFILQKILSFLYFIYLSRLLGPVDLGLYDPMKSLIPILLIVIDFSLSVVLVREIARTPEKTEDYLANVLGVKVIFALVVLGVVGLITNFSPYDVLTKAILYLDVLIVVLDTFTLTFFAVFRGGQNMRYESIGMIVTQFFTVAVGALGLQFSHDLRIPFVAVATGSVFNFFFSFIMLRRKLGVRVRLSWNRPIILQFLKTAIPFAIAAVLVKIYTYADRYMLLAIHGKRWVGWYTTAHKYTYALEFLPSAFAASIFPAMSAYFVTSRDKLTATFERACTYLIFMAMPICFGIIILADNIIVSLSGPAYTTSVLPLRILISGLIVIFLNFPIGSFLNACNRQAIQTRNMAITVGVNIVMNIVLIPPFSVVGAALSAMVSGVVLCILGFWEVGQVITFSKVALLRAFGKSTVAALAMAAVIFIVQELVPVTFHLGSSPILKNWNAVVTLSGYIAIGMAWYAVTLRAVNGFTFTEVKSLFQKALVRR